MCGASTVFGVVVVMILLVLDWVVGTICEPSDMMRSEVWEKLEKMRIYVIIKLVGMRTTVNVFACYLVTLSLIHMKHSLTC